MKDLEQFQYSVTEGMNAVITVIPTYSSLKRFFSGKNCIELGCADGGGTKILLQYFDHVTAVDGSSTMLTKLKQQIQTSKLTTIQSYFEELNLKEKFDTIVMCHILEHVDNPIEVLRIAKTLAHEESKIIIAVPNALSLHRQAGVLLEMISDEHELNETDKKLGHQRVYDKKQLEEDIDKSGLKLIKSGGLLIKCFSNSQLESIMGNSPKKIRAYTILGERYPDIAAEIYAICSL